MKKKAITKVIKIKNLKKNYNFSGITYTYPYGYDVSTTFENYAFEIEGSKRIDMLNNDLDKNIKNIRIVYEVEQEILDEEEKKYLSNVIKPFRKDVEYISKLEYDNKEYIYIDLVEESFSLPMFEKNTMYRGMKIKEEYSLEELGL